MTFSEQIDELLRDPGSPRLRAALKKRISDFVIQHIDDQDEWDRDWPEIGHKHLDDECRCFGCNSSARAANE